MKDDQSIHACIHAIILLAKRWSEQYTVSGCSLLFLDHSFCAPLNIYIGQAVAEEEQERMEKRKTDDALRKEEDIHVMMRLSHKGESFLPGDITLRCGGGKRKGYCTHINIDFGHLFRATVGTKAMAMHHNFI